jgi:hypothetical protein
MHLVFIYRPGYFLNVVFRPRLQALGIGSHDAPQLLDHGVAIFGGEGLEVRFVVACRCCRFGIAFLRHDPLSSTVSDVKNGGRVAEFHLFGPSA